MIRASVANRVLASFAVTVVVFAATFGWSVIAQRRSVEDYEELAKGFLPAALRLGQLVATQETIATLVDGVPDEREPLATRLVLETLLSVRRAKLTESRAALREGLSAVGGEDTRRLAVLLVGELDSGEQRLVDDKRSFDALFFALHGGDKDGANRVWVELGAREHDAAKRFHALADRLNAAMEGVTAAEKARERRAVWALAALAALTLGVGALVSLHTRRLLRPLGVVTERAKAVARGDLTPRTIAAGDDEIGELAKGFERMVGAVARAQSLAVANERLAAIGKMAAHVTHEIRNPLSSIVLNIDLLEEELGGQEIGGDARALLAAIAREVQRLEHLSEEYLRVARLPQPRMEAEDVATALHEIASFARAEMERAGCSLALRAEGPLPPALFDEGQLRQAVLNLLRNAREAMPEGGPVEVAARAEGMGVVIEVADRGGGIPDDIRARVFDPFFSTKGEGTGLGLAITRHIVEAHGGTIACEARAGGGTVFRVALPLAPSRSVARVESRAARE